MENYSADAIWKLFKETGNIIFYLIYRELTEREKEESEKTA